MATQCTTIDFNTAVMLATAKRIAAQHNAGDIAGAQKQIEQHVSALSDIDSVDFMNAISEFIQRG